MTYIGYHSSGSIRREFLHETGTGQPSLRRTHCLAFASAVLLMAIGCKPETGFAATKVETPSSATAAVSVNSATQSSSPGAVVQNKEIKVEELPEAAQAALKKLFDKTFRKAASGNHVTRLNERITTWIFRGTGDDVFVDLKADTYSTGSPYIVLNGLRFKVSKLKLTKADQLNGWTEKYLCLVHADAIKTANRKAESTGWYHPSKGLNWRRTYLVKGSDGTWKTQSFLSREWTLPPKSIVSKL